MGTTAVFIRKVACIMDRVVKAFDLLNIGGVSGDNYGLPTRSSSNMVAGTATKEEKKRACNSILEFTCNADNK